jgi:hypothetical protein
MNKLRQPTPEQIQAIAQADEQRKQFCKKINQDWENGYRLKKIVKK